jgi:hypothetical protein
MTTSNADSHEPSLTDLIAAEVRLLRKGRGLQVSDLDSRLGPYLRELAAGGADRDAATRRRTLAADLSNWAALLGDDLRIAISASLALSAPTRQMPLFSDRVSWLAAQLSRDYRTALRRIDAAEQMLAEEIASELRRRRGRTATAPHGWYLDEFRTVLRLDTPTPEAHEHRRIVATHADLKEIMAWLDIPRSSDQPHPKLSAEILYGGRLVRKEQPSRNRFQLMVQLPTPLQPGEAHEYGLILRMPTGEPMRPHYIFTPECQCNSFDLRVRFNLNHRPVWVRRVEGETVRMFDTAQPAENLAALDEAGEVHLQFRNPTMYLGYGAQWQL